MARPGKTKIKRDRFVSAFAGRLRDERRRLGMSQQRLAESAAVNAAYLGRIERAEVCPGIDMVGRLAAALGLDPAVLVSSRPQSGSAEIHRGEVRAHFERLVAADDPAVLQALAVVLGALDGSLTRAGAISPRIHGSK
jgi:transcriptional regulator with XRE-family HTH domain